VRASIFSRIVSRLVIDGCEVLDIFAGSGSLGLEALSRGAASAVFIDSSKAAADVIQQNVTRLEVRGKARVFIADWRKVLPQIAATHARFDLVFVDPPFVDDCSAKVLAKLVDLDLLKPHGIVTVRQFHRAPELVVEDLELLSQARLGDHRIALYRPALTADAVADGLGSHAE
jgi:16S rRNA (guanine(966)-N(2))-methyltransferase RsmD